VNIKLFPLLFLALALHSCDEKKIYHELDKDFPENRWQKSVTKNFEFSIEQEARNYDVEVHFAYFSDYVVNPVPLLVTITHPDQSQEKKEINITVKDNEGKEIGDCGGDYCDIRKTLFKDEALKKGIYKVAIVPNFSGAYLPNVNGIGIEVTAQAD
jgi:gliding motility-associated lipoprotein GldH